MECIRSSEAKSLSASQKNIPTFMDLSCSLPYLQEPTILPFSETRNIVQIFAPCLRSILILSSDLLPDLSSALFPSDFDATSSYLILATSQ